MRIISPSILSADFGRLESETLMLNQSVAEWIHIDVMDGVFVPNISFGFPVLKSIKQHATKILDVHLMIVNPERYVERFAKAGADIIVFHLEATEQHLSTIELIKKCGVKAGISIKPNTPVDAIEHLLPYLDLVLVMSVEPGFAGQAFCEGSIEKVVELKSKIEAAALDVIIEVDGGVNAENAGLLFAAGAQALVAGSSVFSAADPKGAIIELLNA
ncbi:MAG: ribulose-phosphate 3-epimerase [Rikenellaceae bacterium]